MSLRKSPARTPAFMAAQRANAQKSTGPRTPRGKARVALNGLRHGRFAFRLTENLALTGNREDEALYRWVLTKLTETFGSERPIRPGRPEKVLAPGGGRRDLERLARQGWCLNRNARQAAFWSANPQCTLESAQKSFQHHRRSLLQIHVTDPEHRVGVAFWVRRRWRYNLMHRVEATLGLLGEARKAEALECRPEQGLRWRRFRPALPGWQQLMSSEKKGRRVWA